MMDTSVMPTEERHQDGFEGQWWEYPILRNALMAGVLAGVGFVLAHTGFISEQVELVFMLWRYHWAATTGLGRRLKNSLQSMRSASIS